MSAVDDARPAPVRGGHRKRGRWFPLVAAALGIAVSVLIVYPLVVMLIRVFVHDGALDTSAFAHTWHAPRTAVMLLNTLVLVGLSTSAAVVLGSAFAWLNERTDARLGWLSDALPVIPMMVPPLAGTIGWVLLLSPGPGALNVLLRKAEVAVGVDAGNTGPLTIFSWYGLVFVYTLYLVPHAYLTVAAALRNLDPSLEEASRTSGAGPGRTLVRVTLPAVRPAIAAGALLALVIALALFSVPVLIGTGAGIDVLAVRIVRLTTFQFPPDIAGAVVLGLVLVVVVGGAWLLQARFLRMGRHATIGAGRAGGTTKVPLGRWRWPARAVLLTYVLVTSVLPFLALVFVSLQAFWSPVVNWGQLNLDNYRQVLVENELTKTALRNSVLLGVVGATVSVSVAAVVVVFVQRNSTNALGRTVDGVTKLPGALSHVVMAVALIAALAGPPFRLSGTLLLLFLAYLILYMPQSTVTAGSSLAQVDRALSEASLTSGASQGRTFRKVVLPLMAPGLAAGWVFVFVLMAGDVTASVMLASTRTPVAGFVMLDLFNNGTYPALAALAVVVSILTSAVVLAALSFSRYRGRSGTTRRLGPPTLAADAPTGLPADPTVGVSVG